MSLNITEADRINQRSVARAVAKLCMHHWGRIVRAQGTYSDTHRIDFRLDRLDRDWTPIFYFEVKCRLKKYDPFKIARHKIEAGFRIAQAAGLPFWLWVWFSTDTHAMGVLIDDLNFPSSRVFHGKRPGNGEDSFDFHLRRFTHEALVTDRYVVSPNSDR